MIRHNDISNNELRIEIRQHLISVGGNIKLKIYGKLNCKSGKRMKKENRIFFSSEKEATEQGFRPCGNCMSEAYKKWKNGLI